MFRPLTALQELNTSHQSTQLVPKLLALGVPLEEASALAHNLVVLFYALFWENPLDSPWQVLERLSLNEIATLCQRYYALEDSGEFGTAGTNETKEGAHDPIP